jgi:hypothetical protein
MSPTGRQYARVSAATSHLLLYCSPSSFRVAPTPSLFSRDACATASAGVSPARNRCASGGITPGSSVAASIRLPQSAARPGLARSCVVARSVTVVTRGSVGVTSRHRHHRRQGDPSKKSSRPGAASFLTVHRSARGTRSPELSTSHAITAARGREPRVRRSDPHTRRVSGLPAVGVEPTSGRRLHPLPQGLIPYFNKVWQ